MGIPIMKNPYAPAFWCVFFALVLLSATYFYGVMLAHQIDKAMVFLDSACLVIGTLSIGVVAWASYQNLRVKKKLLEQGKTRFLGMDFHSTSQKFSGLRWYTPAEPTGRPKPLRHRR